MSHEHGSSHHRSPPRGFNRAENVDQNFLEFVREWNSGVTAAPVDHAPVLAGSTLDVRSFRELLESQLISRQLDLMARVLRMQNKVFYTIGSSGNEGNAMGARATRHNDPAFLHYRSGGFMAECFRKLPGPAVRRGCRPEGRRLHGHQRLAQSLQEHAGVQYSAR